MIEHPAPMRLLALVLLLVASIVPGSAGAAGTYFTTPQLLKAFFPKSERVTYRKILLDPSQQRVLEKRLGYTPARREYVVFVALTGERIDGYALIDDERGQHEPITFAVKFSPTGVVERHEVMVYREGYGDEITDSRFRAQFAGKTGKDVVRAGQDIDVVTGATISSRSMAVGVRRAIALVEELVIKPAAIAGKQDEAAGTKG
ncbi:FMN-binding protein [Vulgatibacter sp.]|uniref:FMN-binding protein n=1 Tax=Vulgatibacter sp. TaxID=1971226 RepID=UPI003561976C